jgi:hypothetical protein
MDIGLLFKLSIIIFIFGMQTSLSGAKETQQNDLSVTINENETAFILSNGFISATISKQSGSIMSIIYNGGELLAGRPNRPSAMWSHDATSNSMLISITIDPSENIGTRGEISIKGFSNKLPMGKGPGGSFIADIEIRYAIEKNESGIYTYCIFDHPEKYPASAMGEARFVAFLNNEFDIVKRYPEYFPEDVNYSIGESKYQEDWFFEQIPHVENPDAQEANKLPEIYKNALIKALGINGLPEKQYNKAIKSIEDLGLSGKYAHGKSTTWKIHFFLPDEIEGDLFLRLAICGTGTKKISVQVNNKIVGIINDLRIDGTPNRNGIAGMWYERIVNFKASLLVKGKNTIALTIPEGRAANGIIYDYVRLEHKASK